MELGKQIKRLRNERGWNQEEFAEKAYVSRQTVSNWENEKSYPDVKSLLILSDLFGVSIDELVKGDVEIMKEKISKESIKEFNNWSKVLAAAFLVIIIAPYPLARFLGWPGLAIYALLIIAAFCVAFKVEALKKQNDIQTYKEITAFVDGKSLDDIEKQRDEAKRPYQKALLAIGTGALALAVFGIMALIIK